MCDKTDKLATESMSNLSDFMAYLYARYGTVQTVMIQSLDNLENLETPNQGSGEDLERNLVQISATLTLCVSEEHRVMWTCVRLGKIVNKSMTEDIRKLFWGECEMLKKQCYEEYNAGTPTRRDTWESFFDQKFFDRQIIFLSGFIHMQLNILRNMNVGLKNKKKAVGNVIDPMEGSKCPLCSTGHKSDTQPV